MPDDEHQPGEPATDLGWFVRGLLHALSYPAWTVALAQAGVGSIARDAGQPIGVAMASTLLVWAGPGQIIFFGGLKAGLAPLAIAAAVCLSSMRLLPMTMSILPLVRRPGQGLGIQLLAAHYVAVTAWVEGLRRLPALPKQGRLAYFLGFSNALIVVSTITTGLGFLLVDALPLPLAAGLLFVTPVFFSISVAAGARRVHEWLAILLGFGLEPLALRVVGESADLLLVGVVAGTVAFLVGRARGQA